MVCHPLYAPRTQRADPCVANSKSYSSTSSNDHLPCTYTHKLQVMIARAATAQDDITGDGTTSVVLLVGELLKQADRYISEGLHPRVITDGYEIAKTEALKFLDEFKLKKEVDRELLLSVARTS